MLILCILQKKEEIEVLTLLFPLLNQEIMMLATRQYFLPPRFPIIKNPINYSKFKHLVFVLWQSKKLLY